MARYANTGEFNILYPTRRKMATILKRIIRNEVVDSEGTLVESVRINAKVTGFQKLEIQIVAMYYFIFLNNGVPQIVAQVLKWVQETLEDGGIPVLLGYSLGKAQEIAMKADTELGKAIAKILSQTRKDIAGAAKEVAEDVEGTAFVP